MSQSQRVKEVVDELVELRREYEAKQAEIRERLHALFSVGPTTPQREILKKVIDFFCFPNL